MGIIGALLGIAIAWCTAILLFTFTGIQRQFLYAHRLPIWLGQDLNKPETFGYLKNQVAAFHIRTQDAENLYAWLVTPLAVYAAHEHKFVQESLGSEPDVKEAPGFQLLSEDPKSRLVIYFHGNAGTVGQTRRTQAYRSISSGDSSKIYVLAWDYRGFGRSTGSPTERGLVQDAIDIITWALEVARLSPNRIVLLAQSTGTAVAAAAAAHFLRQEEPIEFAGLILCATFPDVPSLLRAFTIKSIFPPFAPLRLMSSAQAWFDQQLADKWQTSHCVQEIVRRSSALHLIFVQAKNDKIVAPKFLCELFRVATKAGEQHDDDTGPQHGTTRTQAQQLGDGGLKQTWALGNKKIEARTLNYGGHNTIMTWSPVALAVAQILLSAPN